MYVFVILTNCITKSTVFYYYVMSPRIRNLSPTRLKLRTDNKCLIVEPVH